MENPKKKGGGFIFKNVNFTQKEKTKTVKTTRKKGALQA